MVRVIVRVTKTASEKNFSWFGGHQNYYEEGEGKVMRFIVYKKLSKEEAEKLMSKARNWFESNPRRRVCRTDLFKIRRNYIREDILEHTF